MQATLEPSTATIEDAPAISKGAFVFRTWPTVLLASAMLGLTAAMSTPLLDLGPWASNVSVGGTLVVLTSLLIEIVRHLRRGEFGLDLLAAMAMGSALWFGEYLASAIVAVMYAGGQFLEAYAHSRAESGMTELLSRVPRRAVRMSAQGLCEVATDVIVPGDELLIRRGDPIPVDGRVRSPCAVIDQSALTGESLPAQRKKGQSLMSGATNAGDAFEMVATRPAGESTYAGIVRLVEQAKSSKAPMARLAEKYSLAFLGVAASIAGIAVLLSGEMIRLVAVLVVATPCPLILAVPVALVSGTSKAARHGVLIKGAGALEALAETAAIVLDKTGTLTTGTPVVTHIETTGDANELLRLAASADQVSAHTIGRSIVQEAKRRGLALSRPSEITELPGEGVQAVVDGHTVAVGGRGFVASRIDQADASALESGPAAKAFVVADGRHAGTIILEDRLRDDALVAIPKFRALGIRRTTLATGDRPEVARAVGEALRLDAVKAGLKPSEKVQVVNDERRYGRVMMIGDGVNDAPALAAADIGLAVGRGNLAAAAEAADVVLLRDDLNEIPRALEIARRARRIALQSVYVGMGLSITAMVAAGFGLLSPVQGALLQEAIDVAVVMNALRALA